jgi:hypothetical protein
MSGSIDRLEGAFPEPQRPRPVAPASSGGGGIGADYERKLKRLGQRWLTYLQTTGTVEEYASASEVDMAIVSALVKRNFTDAEIWKTLADSPRYQDRIKRKGQRHTDDLYTLEIQKARQVVVPFPPDPEPRRAQRAASRPIPRSTQPPAAAQRERVPFTLLTEPGSFVSRYVAYATKRTDAPSEAHELVAIGALSALAGPIVRLPIATAVHGWRLVLWVCYIVNSTVGRKSTVVNLIQDIIEPVLGSSAFLQWEGSPQGFIQKLQERDSQTAVFIRDEYSGLMQQANRGGHMAGLFQTLIRAYDGGTIENIRVRKKNRDGEMEQDVDRANDPYLVTLSASTRDSFITRATIDNVLDGFLARFIFVTGAAEPRQLPVITAAIRAERDALIRHAREFVERAHQMAELAISQEVLDASWATEQAWLLEAQDTEYPDALAASYKRLSESVLKVAALLAIDRGEVPQVQLRDYETALAIAEQRWKQPTRELVETLGQTEFARNCDRVLLSIRRQPGIPLSHLYRLHRKLKKRDFDEVLAALEQQEMVERIDGEADSGRAPVLFFPCGAGASDEMQNGRAGP